LATNHWESLPIDSSDVTAIRLTGEFGEVRIINIYNDCTHSRTLECLERFLLTPTAPTTASNQNATKYDIWLGDFNRHDPLWENPDNAQLFTATNLDEAEVLINLLADFGMDIALEPGVPTLEHMVTKNLHRVDHVFCSHGFSPRFTRCEVLHHDRPPKTDHYPIVSVIDLSVKRTKETPRRNFRDTDWDEFKKGLKAKLSGFDLIVPTNIEEFHVILEFLSSSITDNIQDHVPIQQPISHRKRWWSRELGQARTALRTLAKKAYKLKSEEKPP